MAHCRQLRVQIPEGSNGDTNGLSKFFLFCSIVTNLSISGHCRGAMT